MAPSFKDSIKTKLEDEKKLFVLNTMFTAAWLDQIYTPIFKKNGVTNPQYNILRILNGSLPKPLSVGEIKERILFKQTDITRMIDRLVDKGFVKRQLCENNRRKMDVQISKKGIDLLVKILPLLNEAEAFFFDNITEKEAILGNIVLDKVRGNN